MFLTFRNRRDRRLSRPVIMALYEAITPARRFWSVPGLIGRDTDRLLYAAIGLPDLDIAHSIFRRGADKIDMQQAVIEKGAGHLDAIGEHEGALELARGDAAVEIEPFLVVD